MVERPGAGPPVSFGPLTVDPGVAEEPAPLGCCEAALEPVVPVDAAPAPLLVPPPLWARASPPERASIATVAPRCFMVVLHIPMENNGAPAAQFQPGLAHFPHKDRKSV